MGGVGGVVSSSNRVEQQKTAAILRKGSLGCRWVAELELCCPLLAPPPTPTPTPSQATLWITPSYSRDYDGAAADLGSASPLPLITVTF